MKDTQPTQQQLFLLPPRRGTKVTVMLDEPMIKIMV
jgi:hypothetical protein